MKDTLNFNGLPDSQKDSKLPEDLLAVEDFKRVDGRFKFKEYPDNPEKSQ